MKWGIFTLTKNEQRVVVLVVLALVVGAFIRYWRDTNATHAAKVNQGSAATTPLPSPADSELNLEEGSRADERYQTPSPQSSP
jgi:hypothetical protein